MTQVEQLLRRTMGLDAASIGSSLIHRTVRLRMKALGIARNKDYFELLAKSTAEWNELLESVIVTETWFFRDREPFSALVRLVQEEWLPTQPAERGRPLRLLSVPCSSGEEPYSLAMALLNAGLIPGRFQIDAVDISARVLAKAKMGVYGKNSFRGKDLAFRDRYFTSTREGFVLREDVRRCVTFRHENLLSEHFLKDRVAYDFIFCRNLLIYFDRPTQKVALQKLDRLLTTSGFLFVGAAEQPWVIEHGFVPANIPMAFACRKASYCLPGRSHERPKISRRPPAWVTKAPPIQVNGQPLPKSSVAPSVPDAKVPKAQVQADLEAARRLADAGRFEEAAEICRKHLKEAGASAQAYYLLGLVRDASGDPAAGDYYRKALYLEPNHYESLLQLSLLAQKNGDAARARAYRTRAERLKTKA